MLYLTADVGRVAAQLTPKPQPYLGDLAPLSGAFFLPEDINRMLTL